MPELAALTHCHPAHWVAWWQRPICHKISEHLTLNRMTRNKVQLKLSQLCSPHSDIASRIRVMEHDS
jgi:hypothetical protein